MQSIIKVVKDTFHVSTKSAAVLAGVCALMFLGLSGFVVTLFITTDYHNSNYSNCQVSAKPAPYWGGYKGMIQIYPITTSCGSFHVHPDLYDSISLNETYDIVTGPKTMLEQPDAISAVPSKK